VARRFVVVEPATVRRGAKTKILGAVVMFLAILNSLLLWRGGEQPAEFYFLLLIAGGFLFALGAIRGMNPKAVMTLDKENLPKSARKEESL